MVHFQEASPAAGWVPGRGEAAPEPVYNDGEQAE